MPTTQHAPISCPSRLHCFCNCWESMNTGAQEATGLQNQSCSQHACSVRCTLHSGMLHPRHLLSQLLQLTLVWCSACCAANSRCSYMRLRSTLSSVVSLIKRHLASALCTAALNSITLFSASLQYLDNRLVSGFTIHGNTCRTQPGVCHVQRRHLPQHHCIHRWEGMSM